MKIVNTHIPDVKIIEPKVFGDERGFFFESFNQQIFEAAIGRAVTFVQDNHSKSACGVLRGLHYQLPPHAQGKLVRVVQGAAWDVAVDIRPHSATYGEWFGLTLSAKTNYMMWIPEGFAHGFVALEDNTQFLYKTTDYYNKAHERSIYWNDPTIAIDWPLNQLAENSEQSIPIISAKDAIAPMLQDI